MRFDHLIRQKIEELFDQPYGKPTDIIGFRNDGKMIAEAIAPMIGEKEVCFFDEEIKTDADFHYLEFVDMLRKSAIMIFTIELPEKYYKYLPNLNKDVKIFLPKGFSKTIAALQKAGYGDNLILY